MIYDILSESARYKSIGVRLVAGLAYLEQVDPNSVAENVVLEGRGLFVSAQNYSTRVSGDVMFEVHRRYADIHFLLQGEETIEFAETSASTEVEPYSDEADVALYKGASIVSIRLVPGRFLVIFPGELHKPGCQVTGIRNVSKLVVKVLL